MFRLIPLVLCLVSVGTAADWPQYRCDAGRTGHSPEGLPGKPVLHWVHNARHAPERAWPRAERLDFDSVFGVVVKDGLLAFGSSADCKLHVLDARTGSERWSFFTEGPIRFAPLFFGDRVIVGSDDGWIYSLSASDGTLVWRTRGGPRTERVLGNGRLVSRWPVRGAPVVKGETLYVAAGIWPSDGIFIRALDARTGRELWCNSDSGTIYMAQPHGGAFAESGVASQGYLAVGDKRLFVPTGRAVPAAFDLSSGAFQYFHLHKFRARGGSGVMVAGAGVFNGSFPYDVGTGELVEGFRGTLLAAAADLIARMHETGVDLHRWVREEKPDRKGKTAKVWRLKAVNRGAQFEDSRPEGAACMIVAGNTAIVGGRKTVAGLDLGGGSGSWSLDIDGVAGDLAVADGALYVSTDSGRIYCFGAAREREAVVVDADRTEAVEPAANIRRAVTEILERSGTSTGFCVDLGCGDGSLALELARRSALKILAVEPDVRLAAAARKKLDVAGLHGTRVTVVEAALGATAIPARIANLVVSGRAVTGGGAGVDGKERDRLLRPYGGVSCIGVAGAMEVIEKGALEGAGEWTHQYANPGNTSCSEDTLVRGQLKMLWFRDVGQEVTQRHGRGPSPLFSGGRLFSEGLDSLIAVDAYNGERLWEYRLEGILRAFHGDHLMGTSGAGSNFCIGGESVFVRVDDHCLRIDVATGRKLGMFSMPVTAKGGPGRWGYIAAVDDTLYGSAANPAHVVTFRYKPSGDLKQQLTESSHLFALNARTGESRWTYTAEHSIRHNTIAIGGGRVYLVDRPLAMSDRKKKAPADAHPGGTLVAIDSRTGDVAWRSREDIYGTVLALATGHDGLLMSYQPTSFRLASERGGRMTVFSPSTGSKLWEKKVSYSTRPVLIGRTIYAQGGAWDVLTGEERPFNFKRSYGCGQLAASSEMLIYRSATLGYFDLRKNDKNRDFGGLRPGCWINAIPAGGMVLMPDGSAGCTCSYLNRSWIALDSTGD